MYVDELIAQLSDVTRGILRSLKEAAAQKNLKITLRLRFVRQPQAALPLLKRH